MDTDEAIDMLANLAAEMKYKGILLEKDSSLPLGPHLEAIRAFGDELELLAAGFRGEQRYSVTLHFPSIIAQDEKEAVGVAHTSGTMDGYTIHVDGKEFSPVG